MNDALGSENGRNNIDINGCNNIDIADTNRKGTEEEVECLPPRWRAWVRVWPQEMLPTHFKKGKPRRWRPALWRHVQKSFPGGSLWA